MDTAPDAPLRLENVTVRFGPVTALDGVNVSLQRGETVIVLGAAGSGKTVFLKTALALIAPNEGDVYLFGQATRRLKEIGRASCRERV